MADDHFEIWLGHVGKDRPLRHELRKAANLAGRAQRASAQARRFDGSRIGRGAGIARLLGSSDRFGGSHARRVVVKIRYVKLAGKGAKAAAAHLKYLQRDGTTREGERGTLYGADRESVDGKAFLARGQGDRHQFRLIVSPEDGAEYQDLKPLTRRLMRQIEADLGTRLEWAAVDHYNTGHPHTHIVVRGVDERGANLIIAREYISRGIALRAAELVNLDLGPRTTREIIAANAREIAEERFTQIDRRLLQERDAQGLASAWHGDPIEQSLRAGRLATLARMGLAEEEGKGRYRLDPELEVTLRAMGRRGDIIATMHERLRSRPDIVPHDYAIYDPAKAVPITGRVMARGLADEHDDKRYLIVEATDGRSHYVDLGSSLELDVRDDALVRVLPRLAGVRAVDRTVADIAAANGGTYSIALHLRHDPAASERFAQAHVRRLEAIRKGSEAVERQADGSWTIAPDHLDRVLAWERARAEQRPVQIDMLSERPLEQMVRHDGVTWLDEQCVVEAPEPLQGGFGARVREALGLRRQWLIEEGLAWGEGEAFRVRPNMLASLRQRELRQAAVQLSKALGLDYVEHRDGIIEGTCRGAVQVGASRYALIEKSQEFTLVPWRPVLERQVGHAVMGIERGGSISWTFGRGRPGPEIG